MTFEEFINKYNGKAIDFDGYAGAQCFDLYRQYCKEYFQVPQSPATGDQGAKVIWNNYLKDYFDAIPNSPLNVPLEGDIVIWGEKIGPYGHVAIFKEGNFMKFTSFDQNWANKKYCTFIEHPYTGVLGWLRRKQPIPIDNLPTRVVTEEVRLELDQPLHVIVASPEPSTSVPGEKTELPTSETPKLNIFQQLFEWLTALLRR